MFLFKASAVCGNIPDRLMISKYRLYIICFYMVLRLGTKAHELLDKNIIMGLKSGNVENMIMLIR